MKNNYLIFEELESRMVKRCVAAGCSNTNADGVSLFNFQKTRRFALFGPSKFEGSERSGRVPILCVVQWTLQWWMLRCWIEVSCWVWNEKDKKAESRCCPKYIYQVLGDEWNPQRASLCSSSSIIAESSSKKRMAYEKHENYSVCIIAEL